MIVLDTSALVFWTLFPSELSEKAAETIQEAEVINICSISIWEIGIKVKKGHLFLPYTLPDYVTYLDETLKVLLIPVSVAMWLENVSLPWEHQDPADRTIVACAQLMNCPLVTSDSKIASFYPQTVW